MVSASLTVRVHDEQENLTRDSFMLLFCPSCSGAFRVSPAAIGEQGRTVRCAACKHKWHATTAELIDEELLALADADPGHHHGHPDPMDAAFQGLKDMDGPSLVPEDGDGEHADIERAAALRAARRKLPVKPAKAKRKFPWPWAALGLLFALLAAAVNMRESVVRYWPGAARAFSFIGMRINLRGIEFRELETVTEMQDGIPFLVVRGWIANVAPHGVDVPRIRLVVVGAADEELYAWTAVPPRPRLSEGESAVFVSRLASPPPNGKRVLVRFLNKRDLAYGVR